jgi:poly-beta-1,6-N-acetyl-D-glucosamine synthase
LFFTIIAIAYFLLVILLIIGWNLTSKTKVIHKKSKKYSLSVIIVVRNEEKNIGNLLQDIENQYLDKNNFELIVVNDFSEDATVSILEKFKETASYSLKILQNDQLNYILSPKKRGITQAIAIAKGEIIVCTDGDCHVPNTWLLAIYNFFEEKTPAFVSGLVTFLEEQTFFQNLQTVEFASLVASGAATLRLHNPTMCNGANLAFLKSAFQEVNGYEGTEQIASGDDEFLMHKIAIKYPNKVFFLKSKDSIVCTQAIYFWRDFLHQRTRWGSKWEHYKSFKIKILAFFIFVANLNILLILGAFATNFLSGIDTFFLIFSKFVIELVFLSQILIFLKKSSKIIYFPIVFFLYPFYVIFFGLISRKKQYFWKGRKFS